VGFLVKKCRLCGQRYPANYAELCDVDFGDDWLFWCEKHERLAQALGCDECAFKFRGNPIFEPTALGLALFDDWSEAIKEIRMLSIFDWLVESDYEPTLVARIREIDLDQRISLEDKLSLGIMFLRGDNALCWRGKLIDWNWLCSNEDQGIQLLKGDFPIRVAALGLGTWLSKLKAEWQSTVQQVSGESAPSPEDEQTAFGMVLSKGTPTNLLAALSMTTLVPRIQARRMPNLKSEVLSETAVRQRRAGLAPPDQTKLNETFALICSWIQSDAMPSLDGQLAYEATFMLAWQFNGKAIVEYNTFRHAFQDRLRINFESHLLRSLIFNYLREFSKERSGFVTAVAKLIRSGLRDDETLEFAAWRALDSAYGLFSGSKAPKRCARHIEISEHLEDQLLSLGLSRSVRWGGFSAELMLERLNLRRPCSITQWNTLRLWMERCTPILKGRESELISAIILPWTRRCAPSEIRSGICSFLIGCFGKPQANHIIWKRCSQIVRETVSEWLLLTSLEKPSELTVNRAETTRESSSLSPTARKTRHDSSLRFLQMLGRAIRRIWE
jgi:EH signature protein